jgi:predicted short-subunit dehydrogenase-like oxidoreductase (DUF2520 family)
MNFGIIGAGIVGTALAIRLEQAGHRLVGVLTRSETSFERFSQYLCWEKKPLEKWITQADFVFITPQDGMIRSVAKELSDRKLFRPGQIWIHCSGSMSSKVLRVDESLPVNYLSLHPLQSFASIDQAVDLLRGTHFGIEGDAEDVGEKIIAELGGIPHRLDPDRKPLYHAGAVIASNYLVTIAGLAVRLFEEAGIERAEALDSLLPLMEGTLRNLKEVGLPQALTGPVARGDVEVLRSHLEQMPMRIGPVYRALGLSTLEIGQAKKEASGSKYSKEAWEEMNQLFE